MGAPSNFRPISVARLSSLPFLSISFFTTLHAPFHLSVRFSGHKPMLAARAPGIYRSLARSLEKGSEDSSRIWVGTNILNQVSWPNSRMYISVSLVRLYLVPGYST